MYFKKFYESTSIVEGKVVHLNEGIDHIEALPARKFIDAIKKLSTFIASEKLDGANLVFGFDSNGRFYTSRESKGSSHRCYSVSDYEKRAADNGFKSAHAALEKVKPQLKTVVDNGEAVEVEVLFGRQPNAIVYGSNYVAFLRMLPGDNKKLPQQSKIKKLHKTLDGKQIQVNTELVTTKDGVHLKTTKPTQKWNFTSVAYIDSHHFHKVNVDEEIKEFERFLERKVNIQGKTFTNEQLLTVKLPSVPKDIRQDVKIARENVVRHSTDLFKLPIKEKILQNVLRALKPSLQDQEIEPHEDIGVEGVVLLDPDTLEQLKIVDKDVFTTINQFNYAVRNEIKATSNKKIQFSLLGRENDIFGEMLGEIQRVLGIPGLERYTNIKRTIKKYKGKNEAETITNLVRAVHTKDVDVAKSQITDAIDRALMELQHALNTYKKQWFEYSHELKSGKTIKYTEEVHRRTLIVFAETRQEMKKMQNWVRKSDSIADILVSLYGKQIKEILNT